MEHKANKHDHRHLKSDSKLLTCPHSWQPPTFLLTTAGLFAVMSNAATSEEHSLVSSQISLCHSKQSSLTTETQGIDHPHEIALRALGADRERGECPTPTNSEWHTLTIKRGDALSAIFSKFHMSSQPLYQAGLKAGLTDRLIMKLAEIFGWDIDFALDIRQDNGFTVIYEQQVVDGKNVRNRKIVAAEFLNQGEQYKAYLYTNAQGVSDYYTTAGRSVRKLFLKTPVAVACISSRFTAKRRHPLLKRTRAHKGVD
jgi:hypothetical protein